MFLYIFTLCLMSFYSSSGAPTSTAINATAPVSLSALANSCENQFLSTQIKGKLQDCAVTNPPNSEKQFQCMLFYDINRQLCSAVAASRLALTEDYTTTINAPQDIKPLCETANSWTFTDLGETYIKYVKLVFADVIKCTKVCSVDDNSFLDVESNFYCKYFKWGSEILKSQVSIAPPSVSGVAAIPDPHLAVDDAKIMETKPGVPAPINLQDNTKDSVKPNEPATSQKLHTLPQSKSQDVPPSQTGADGSTSEKASSTNNVNVGSQIAPSVGEQQLNPVDNDKEKINDNENVKEHSEPSGEQQPEVPQPVAALPDLDEKIEIAKPDIAVNDDKKSKSSETVAKVLPDVKINQNDLGDGDDYANDIDSEDSRGPDTQQGDDDADPGLPDADLKPELDQSKNSKRIELQVANDISQREYYRGDDFPEEEDHFFPFFLTAIIMVVLLYVLYHNKSKVSKVIMGLIVEGRQPGRRRGSRGHAYKRLDTLEHAISAAAPAQPSKIIY